MESKELHTVAIIGRPNVGKSTLFNRLVGKRVAIETPIPGTTRDRLFGEVNWRGCEFNLLDVAGIESGTKKEIDNSMQEGVEIAINESDLILFVVDWGDKDNATDKMVARRLRQSGKEVLLVVNKVDNPERMNSLSEFSRFGDFTVVPVSAISGQNSGDLLDEVVAKLGAKKITKKKKREFDINLAIIGRPNVGKSTLLNTVVGEKRAIVSSEPGTTRDVVSVYFDHGGKKIAITDTAGIRRPGKIGKDTIESFSVLRTLQALKNCDVAVLVIDGEEGLVALDMNILGKAKEWGKGVILAVNKIDLVEGDLKEYMGRILWELQGKLNFVPWLPIVFISAKDDQNVKPLLNRVVEVYKNKQTVIPSEKLEEILEYAKGENAQLVGIKSLLQKRANPPIFEIAIKGKRMPHYTQVRYLENKIRDVYPLEGTPIFIDLLLSGKNRSQRS